LGEQKAWIEEQGWQLVLVHMDPEGEPLPGIEDTPQLADPHCELYRSFGLGKGSLWQMFQPAVWKRGFKAVLAGNRGGALKGDGLRLPGMFLVDGGEIVASHRGEHAADHGAPADLAMARASLQGAVIARFGGESS
jgi:hypothetical protein